MIGAERPLGQEQRHRLQTAPRIGLLGDTHGDLFHVLTVAKSLRGRGIDLMIVLGDFGFIWPGDNWGATIDKLHNRLRRADQLLLFVDGNHENHRKLAEFPIADDGIRWVRSNIGHLPRGYRTVLRTGKTLAALGGANSIDVGHRAEGTSWWPEEAITELDLDALGDDHADVMIGHDAPAPLPSLDTWLAATDHRWPASGVGYSAAGRVMFTHGFLQVRPTLYLGGHYHRHIDERVPYNSPQGPFEARVVILNMNGAAGPTSQAILDVDTLRLEYFTRHDPGSA